MAFQSEVSTQNMSTQIVERILPNNTKHHKRRAYYWTRHNYIMYVHYPYDSPQPNFTFKKQITIRVDNILDFYQALLETPNKNMLLQLLKQIVDNNKKIKKLTQEILETKTINFEMFAFKKRDKDHYGIECKIFNTKHDKFNDREIVLNFHIINGIDCMLSCVEFLSLEQLKVYITLKDLLYIKEFKTAIYINKIPYILD